jgi:site-specific DNA recombinase
MDDLLREAQSPDRRFDVVICESVDRIARITHYGTKIEHELEAVGVLLLAADEGIILKPKRATNVLTRRVKQSVAEWYILDMLEKALGGFVAHTNQGWNVGQPPYGYVAGSIPHPVPARRAEGKHKTRLVEDTTRSGTVRRIYDLRINQRLGYSKIADLLNEDLALNLPPVPPDPARALGRWSGSSVREILHNPKYTGHMVWNRRASKQGGRQNPVSEWVLSPTPTHPAIISPEQFAQARAVGQQRERSRANGEPSAHLQTRRSYVLRSYVTCSECGRRLWGKELHGFTYYTCYPKKQHRPQGHPVSIVVPEHALLAGLEIFFNDRLLGPDRTAFLSTGLQDEQHKEVIDHQQSVTAAEHAVAEVRQRQERLLHQVEDMDPATSANDPFRTRLHSRYNELEDERRAHEARVAHLLSNPPQIDSPRTTRELLGHLPLAKLKINDMPETLLRELCEAFHIRITHDRLTQTAYFQAEIAAAAIEHSRNRLEADNLRVCDVPPAGLEPALKRF